MADKLYTVGTALSGFVRTDQNLPPRECGNCRHYKHDKCHHPVVMIDPQVEGPEGQPKPVEDEWCCNFFENKIVAYACRHGQTELNAGNAFRGWTDDETAQLDEVGREQAHEAGECLKGKGITHIVCSDLGRAVETAHIIGKIIGVDDIEVDEKFRPLDVGYMTGEPKDQYLDALRHYIETGEKIPEGESVPDFTDRSQAALKEHLALCTPEDIGLFVFHTSNVISLDNLCKDNDDGKPEDTEIVEPGGGLEILESEGEYACNPIFGVVKQGEYGAS